MGLKNFKLIVIRSLGDVLIGGMYVYNYFMDAIKYFCYAIIEMLSLPVSGTSASI